MTFSEANEIYEIWQKWYWPCHFILDSIFINKIPESFLPYSPLMLEEALNIVAEFYFNSGDHKMSKLIQESIPSIWKYEKDEDALNQAIQAFSNPEMKDVMLVYISEYKKRYQDWLSEQRNKR